MSKAKPQLKALDICYLCNEVIKQSDEVDLHHITPECEGGTWIEPVHRECHRDEHSDSGDFARWGSKGGKAQAVSSNKSWPMNLRNMQFCGKVNAHFQ